MTLAPTLKKLVLAQVLLGIIAFAMASRNPALGALAVALALAGWWLVERPGGRALPQWLILVGAVAALGWQALHIELDRIAMVLAIGHFLLWLQVLLLYGRKTNREYGELLMLSLVLIICGSVLTLSLVYALVLLVYCVLALFTLLLFHLKITGDQVDQANEKAIPPGHPAYRTPGSVTGHTRRQFHGTALTVGLGCLVVGALVFTVLPRSQRDKFNPLTSRQVDFAHQIQLDSGVPIRSTDSEPVLTMRISRNGVPITGEESFLLRGAVMDRYNGHAHTWQRGVSQANTDLTLRMPATGVTLAPRPGQAPMYEAEISMQPNSENILFTLFPISSLQSDSFDMVTFNRYDQQITSVGRSNRTISYRLRAPVYASGDFFDSYRRGRRDQMPRGWERLDFDANRHPFPYYAAQWRIKGDEVRRFTEQILQEHGLERDPQAITAANDRKIVHALTDYLRQEYTYELNAFEHAEGHDPILEFLFIHKRGHCELFASALAAMTRSIGMHARVVSGYRASEYNRIGGYYVVRRDDAHAWTEVDLAEAGWQVFDPTPPDLVAQEHAPERNWLTSLGEVYNYFEFNWFDAFLGYNGSSQEQALSNVNESMRELAQSQQSWWVQAYEALRRWQDRRWGPLLLGLLAAALLAGLIGLGWLIRRTLMRRRQMAALHLDRLPPAQRRRLAQDCGFYFTMAHLLQQHGYERPAWQPPQTFAMTLARQEPERFEPVVQLTELLYEIRFGHRPLDEQGREQAQRQLQVLKERLAGANQGA